MIQSLHRYACKLLVISAVMLVHGGCVEHMEEMIVSPTDHISFKASLDGEALTSVVKGFSDCLDFEEEEWLMTAGQETSTKATLHNSLNGLDARVYGYVYNGEWNADIPVHDHFTGTEYAFDGDQLDAVSPVRWSMTETGASDGYKFRTLVYAPKDDVTPVYQTPAQNGNAPKGAPVIQIPDVWHQESGTLVYQKDIVVADKVTAFDMSSGKSHRKEINLDFQHIYTAMQFKAGFDCTITGIKISGVKTGGNYVIGSGWQSLTERAEPLTFTFPSGGLTVNKGDEIGGIVMMIPQNLGDGASISLTYTENGGTTTVTANLSGVEWKQGKKISYTLMRDSDREYIYFDLAAGNVEITDKISKGYVFVKENGKTEPVAKEIRDTIKSNDSKRKYYIYQSCTKNTASPNYKVGFTQYNSTTKKASGTFTKPVYNPATLPDGTLWSDYITNNNNVENVIQAWDNLSGATDNTSTDATKAVRRAGRESVTNTISISGTVGTCTMVIDDIYCSKQHKGQNRTFGSIGFKPTYKSNSSLILHLIGDNRLGCLHYDNNDASSSYGSNDARLANTNFLIIEGEGSLTVADADFYVANSGYYSNHYDSAIGNADNRNATYGIVINSGTIFAGTTKAENSSAIGAGGNGYGDVVINGGVVTAVASTTGTAIGGGIGYSDTGGKGYVEINGGNVYAYNKTNVSGTIPSSAIGGAGSSAKAGSEGTVIITGGYVYAESDLGTAIGGGSSATQPGGRGIVTITGGTVIAKSLSKISAGIGGGSTCTSGGTLASPNGGTAIITVGVENDPTKRPIIRTGSIGGGGTKATGGTVGNAQIYVYGGDIQAQFVMAQSDGNIFEMEGGMIRNSSTSDKTYHCIKPHGGAVYMERGTFTMRGGTIKACKADTTGSQGGAVYIKGDASTRFTMEGGEIRECKASMDGGAVYLEGGTVTLNGGRISGNVAYNGNGGAISILGGDFVMNSTNASDTVLISENAAFGNGNKGNGGGIYVAPASKSAAGTINVSLTKGAITFNSADTKGGGVCVDMGENTSASLNVTVGAASDGPVTKNPWIDSNGAMINGGGIYINGSKSYVLLNDGHVLNNETSSYQVNPDMTVDGGLVTLMKPGITTQITVTFSNNAQSLFVNTYNHKVTCTTRFRNQRCFNF